MSTTPTARPTPITAKPSNLNPSRSRKSPTMKMANPIAEGIAPIVNKAAKGTTAHAMLSTTTRRNRAANVNRNAGFGFDIGKFAQRSPAIASSTNRHSLTLPPARHGANTRGLARVLRVRCFLTSDRRKMVCWHYAFLPTGLLLPGLTPPPNAVDVVQRRARSCVSPREELP